MVGQAETALSQYACGTGTKQSDTLHDTGQTMSPKSNRVYVPAGAYMLQTLTSKRSRG